MEHGAPHTLTCDEAIVELSSRLDGEPLTVPPGVVDMHVRACPACTAFLLGATKLHRAVRLRTAEDVPDMTAAVLDGAPSYGYRLFARYALLAVSLTILILAVPALLFGAEGSAPAHLARHLGALDIAIGVGLLGAAWRPARARSFLPIAAALAGSMLVTAVIDAADGTTPLIGEAYHLLELTGLVLVWALAGFPAPRIDRRSLRFVG